MGKQAERISVEASKYQERGHGPLHGKKSSMQQQLRRRQADVIIKPEPKSKIRCWYRHPHWQLQLSCMPCILYECEAIAVRMHMLGDGVKGVMARCIIN
jgi:hypothetical protein